MEINKTCITNNKELLPGIIKLAKDLIRSGYSILDIVKQITLNIIQNEKLTDIQKSYICLVLSDSEKKIVSGADNYIQLLYILSTINYVSCDEKLNLQVNIL